MNAVPLTSHSRAARTEALFAAGASLAVAQELLAYSEGREPFAAALPTLPLADEPHLAAWAGYVEQATPGAAATVLREVLIQLHFPIRRGISRLPDYLRATRQGQLPAALPPGLPLAEPDKVQISLHEGPAGRLPVIVAGCRADFVTLLQALWYRNEPVAVPDNIGAAFISGYNNWARIRELKHSWLADNQPIAALAASEWAAAFKQTIAPHPGLYQDRFMLVGPGAYSGITAATLGLTPAEWAALSLRLRIEHEYTHYALQRLGWPLRAHALDELLADFRALVEVTGQPTLPWLNHLLGLETAEPGRLAHYRGESPLSEPAFALLRRLVARAAERMAAEWRELPAGARRGPALLPFLASFAAQPLELLATSPEPV